ncbi:WYL domain-containing protein [Blautia schinkii]|nr:WYL domain-containing protein [Blautia schinkii]
MPKSSQQKFKILYLMRVFLEQTDEQHPMTTNQLIDYLSECGISVERKTVYDDIETLRIFGMDIVNRRERPSGFYLASREFELAELKLLVDAVQSSRFITSKKSGQLIQKLEKLTSVHDARLLQQQVVVDNRVKTVNESIYYNIDDIHTAITGNHQISFQYYEWTVSKEMRLRKDGERYRISPWGMIWKDENYYLIGVDEKSGVVKHYRVDKMRQIKVEEELRSGEEIFRDFDVAQFATRTFGMFGGREETLRIEFENRFIGVVIDRFGQDVVIQTKDEEHFTTMVRVNVSAQFFGWLAGLGPGVAIVGPDKVRSEYIQFLRKALDNYRTED